MLPKISTGLNTRPRRRSTKQSLKPRASPSVVILRLRSPGVGVSVSGSPIAFKPYDVRLSRSRISLPVLKYGTLFSLTDT